MGERMSAVSSQREGQAPAATRPGRWWHDRRAVIMMLLGVISGVVGNLTAEFDWLGGPASVGIVFGVFIAVYLVTIRLATVVRAAGFALCSVAAWMIAYRSAIELVDALPSSLSEDWRVFVVGIVAGLLGAALLAAAIAALFRFFRRRRLIVRTALVGAAFGALLWPAMEWDFLPVLLAPWQAAFALCFALGFPAIAERTASRST